MGNSQTITRFFTDTGIVVPAVTTAQMREVDRIALAETGPNLFQMMENAGRNLAELSLELLGAEWRKAKIVALAGSGGNGGGAICAARHLANRGANVRLCLAQPERLGEVPAWQRKIFQSTSGTEVAADKLHDEAPDLIFDGLIGYGLTAAPRGTFVQLIQWANGTSAPILALDVPSGVDSTTGETPGDFIKAHWTMTLALPKTGLLPELTGQLFLADIGIPAETYRRINLKFAAPFDQRFRVPLIVR